MWLLLKHYLFVHISPTLSPCYHLTVIKKESHKQRPALQLCFPSILGMRSFFNVFTLIHIHAHKEHSTSVFEAQRFLLVGEGIPRKANHSSHVSYINDKTATISFGSSVHQAKENWVIHTVNTSYLLPQNSAWILCFKHFHFSMTIIESFHSSCISTIYTFLIVQSNFQAKGFSLCFNISYKTTQHIIVVNSWRLEPDCVFSCYFRHKCLSELSD